MIETIDDKTWKGGWLIFKDRGRIENGITHRFEVSATHEFKTSILGCIEWRAGWRCYTFRPIEIAKTWFDAKCLTILAEFAKMKTDERMLKWKAGALPKKLAPAKVSAIVADVSCIANAGGGGHEIVTQIKETACLLKDR